MQSAGAAGQHATPLQWRPDANAENAGAHGSKPATAQGRPRWVHALHWAVLICADMLHCTKALAGLPGRLSAHEGLPASHEKQT